MAFSFVKYILATGTATLHETNHAPRATIGPRGLPVTGMAAFRPTPSLSVYPNPAAGCLMAILRAYFDDSKDDRILTIAGYLSDLESWGRFDRAWKAVLDKFGVPYLCEEHVVINEPNTLVVNSYFCPILFQRNDLEEKRCLD